MTGRAILIGLIGAMRVADFGYVNNRVLELKSLVAGHPLPAGVLGLLMIAVLAVNPLLFAIRPRLAMRPAELAVIVLRTTVACSPLGAGADGALHRGADLPVHRKTVQPGWRANHVLDYAPAELPVGDARRDPQIVPSFVQRLGRPGGLPGRYACFSR